LAYAQARLQARHGARAPQEVWEPLLATTGFRAFLEQARATPLRSWLANVSPISPLHDVERLVRAELARRAREIARWLPAELHDAVVWTEALVDLPALDYLLGATATPSPADAQRHRALPWMLDAVELKAIAAADVEARAAALAATAYAPLARGPGSLRDRWFAEWLRRLPRLAARPARRLARLRELLRAHLAAFVPPPGAEPMPARAAWMLRRELEHKVARVFRAAFLEPTVVFAFLVLEALEFERVRGALAARLLFSGETH
jgi:hypothetical protein